MDPSTAVHLALGAASMMPVVGGVAAGVDAGLYLYEGDYFDASMSMLAVIPGGALLSKGSKALKDLREGFTAGEEAVKVSEDAVKAEHAVSEAEKAGSESEKAWGEACNLSFTPTTTVRMADGSARAISALRVGDSVAAYDPVTGVTAGHRVLAVMTNLDPAVEHLVTDAGSIDTTPNHPIFTADRAWVNAGDLRTGEHIRTDTGSDAVVVGFSIDAHPATMWDITVEGAHSFFVGNGDLLVHNCGGGIEQAAAQEAALGAAGAGEPTLIAGAGHPRAIDDVDRLVNTYGGSATDYTKWKGPVAKVPSDLGPRSVELHWYQKSSIILEPKVKIPFYNESFDVRF